MKKNLLKDSLLFPLLMQSASGINFLFQLFLARNLSKFDYGLINSLFSMYVLIATPALMLQNTLSRYTSELILKKDDAHIQNLFWKSMKYVSRVSFLLFILILLCSRQISQYLHASRNMYIYLIGFSIALSLIIPVAMGILLGSQKFLHIGFAALISNIIKITLGIVAITLGYQTGGILTGFVISLILSFILSINFIKPLLSLQESTTSFPILKKEIVSYSIKNGITLFALSFLTFFDVIAVQHFFGQPGSSISGIFSIASMISKIILFATQPFIAVMLPKVTSEYCQNRKSIYLLAWYLALTIGVGGGIVIFYNFFPEFVIHFFTQTEVIQIKELLTLYAASILFLSALYITVNYCLAKDQFFIFPILIIGATSEILLFSLFHNRIEHIIRISLYVNMSLTFFSLFFVLFQEKRSFFQRPAIPSLTTAKGL